jgi:adenylate kinase
LPFTFRQLRIMSGNRIAVIMLGPPGAGKGTQARKISLALNYPQISTGDMLREALKNNTELGKKARAFMESGALVPDGLVEAIVRERLAGVDCTEGFILDGYPRTIGQAESLRSLFTETGTRGLTIGIRVSDDVLISRLAGRWTCPGCGKIFNSSSNPSRSGNSCDACGTGLVMRKDDAESVVRERLRVYRKETEPLIQYFKDRDAYIEVDGEMAMEEIFAGIKEIINSKR